MALWHLGKRGLEEFEDLVGFGKSESRGVGGEEFLVWGTVGIWGEVGSFRVAHIER